MSRQEKHERFVLEYVDRYMDTRLERVAVRSALGDATGLCDALAADFEASRRPSKERAIVLRTMKLCADAIYALREKVETKTAANRAALDQEGGRDG